MNIGTLNNQETYHKKFGTISNRGMISHSFNVSDYLCRHYESRSCELKEWYKMPSIKECLAEYEKQDIGLISDIAKHGCSGGVSLVLYYYDETTAFHDQHEEEIWQLVQDQADDNGTEER